MLSIFAARGCRAGRLLRLAAPASTFVAVALVADVLPARAQYFELVAPNVGTVEMASASDLVVYQLAANPDILIFDFPSLEQQGRTFNRVVALIEKQGASRNQVLSDEELAAAIKASGKRTATYAFGNDFRVSELSRFYTLAERGGTQLNADELQLKAYLQSKGYMQRTGNGFEYVAPDRVILSVPQEQGRNGPDHLLITHSTRNAILRHEVGHGEFYDNDDYAAYCENFWYRAMSEEERQNFRTFLGGLGYDVRNEELMINETFAYLIHTPDPAIFNADKVKLPPATVEALRTKFWAGPPPSRLFALERRAELLARRRPQPAPTRVRSSKPR